MDLKVLTSQVAEVARGAGDYLCNERDAIAYDDIDIKGRGDFVSHADHNSEAMIREALENLLPGSVVMGEEDSPHATSQSWRWIVDPLDGTTNYLQGLPVYAVSIALEDRHDLSPDQSYGPLLLGVTYLPKLDVMYTAFKDGGAFKDGNPIRISQKTDMKRFCLATGFPFHSHQYLDDYLKIFHDIFLKIGNVRRAGAACADLAWVAEGVFDGFWEMGLKPWDMAAGIVLIREAGGVVSDFWGSNPLPNGWLIGGNRVAYDELRRVVNMVYPNSVF